MIRKVKEGQTEITPRMRTARRATPRVSVLIPAYNAEHTIGRTLTAAMQQSLSAIEILVVNDGSTDRTSQIISEFAHMDPRIRYIDRPNLGVAAARNAALAMAKSPFVAPLDADDLWHPNKLERQLNLIENRGPSIGLVYTWFRAIDENDNIIDEEYAPRFEGFVLPQLLKENFVGTASSPLLPASTLRKNGYSEELQNSGSQGCEDYMLQLQIALDHQFGLVPAFLTGYRRAKSAMSSDNRRMAQSHVQMFRLLRAYLPHGCDGIARAREAEFLMALSLSYAKRGPLGRALEYAREAISVSPFASASAFMSQLQRALLRLGAVGQPNVKCRGNYLESLAEIEGS